MFAKWHFPLLAASLVLLILPSQAAADQSITISESEYTLTPSSINVTAGEVVHFTIRNTGTTNHNFTVELPSASIEKTLFDTNLSPGETRTVDYTFPQAGTWEMYCPVDSHEDLGMKGTIVVAAAAAPAPQAAPAAQPAPAPAPVPSAPAPRAAQPAPSPQPARPPTQLPNTGEGPGLPIAPALAGVGLLAVGVFVRRWR